MSLPFLDLTAPGFSTRGPEVMAAREAGWCARTPFGFAVLRHRQAGQLLRDRRLRQGSYAWPEVVGLSGSFAAFWQRSIISQEGPRHKILRAVVLDALATDWVTELSPAFTQLAEELLRDLPVAFDFVDRVSEPFAGSAITMLLGLPQAAAPDIARDASSLGLAMGTGAKQHEPQVNTACDRLMKLADKLLNAPPKDRFVARLAASAKARGVNDAQALRDLIVICIFGGVDTTRAQLAFAIHLLAQHPDQWDWLRAHPEAVPQAIDEVIRVRPTTTWATREALEDFEFDGVRIKRGQTVHVLVHAASIEPAMTDASGFDVRLRRKMHFGFGGGAHHCLGQFVARTDMAAALSVMLRQWSDIELRGIPQFLPDSGNTSPISLILAATPSSG